MEIESLVANSALVRARNAGGHKGRSWKWKEMLAFPHISQCMELSLSIERDYFSLCVNQPIGKRLFRQFCQSMSDLQSCVSLLDALETFETKADDERRVAGLDIIKRFLSHQSLQCVEPVQGSYQGCLENLELDPCGDVFKECSKALHQHLSGLPFVEFQDSMYFDRLLQWKAVERQPITKHNFRQYRLLGKGGFGEVWACQVRATGQMYACKKLEKTHVKKRRGETMALNEKIILEKLNSRFVISLVYAYETKHFLCMVLTLMNGGDLRYHIYNMGSPGLDKDRVRFYAAEVCCGLTHLHQMSVVYRDLKPDNILLDDNGHVRISDLGLAIFLSEGEEVQGRVGTMGYMAPEVIANKFYGTSPDWWGLGCLVYEMTAGRPPFREAGHKPNKCEMERRIREEEVEYGSNFSREARSLCAQLLKKDPRHRLGCQTKGGAPVRAHPFFSSINFRMLEAGLVEAPFKPDPGLVYCSDIQDIEEFSAVKGVSLNQADDYFYAQFNTGSVPVTWQNEMIETKCFEELNIFGPGGSRSKDLEWVHSPHPPESPKRGLLHRFRHRHHNDHSGSERSLERVGILSTNL